MIAVLVCLLVMLALQVLTPFWWWIMIVPFAYGAAVAKSGWKALRTGVLSAGLLWLGAGVYFLLTGSRIIAERMAKMFGLGSPWLMVLVTTLIAAVAAALSGYAGYAVRALFRRK
jgi:zinc transporter ZupT